jgi:NAD+ synthase
MSDPPFDLAREGSLDIDPAWTEKLLVGFLRREIERTGLRDAVLGLSGGLDSATSAYLAARALGPDRVHAVLMPYRSSSPDSLRDARAVVADLGISEETVDISAMVDGFDAVTGPADRLRLGNVMARCRMIVLYDRSAVHRALVVGTSNKTEILLGYGTLFGDLASAVNPIGDLYKTQVRVLARHLGVPDAILAKPPSADLWPDQRDEDDLGFAYDDVDRLLALLVDARVSPATVVAGGLDAEFVELVRRRVVRSQFKRRMPLIAKVSPRSVGWDFRYPRDWDS